jgi:MFS family permease
MAIALAVIGIDFAVGGNSLHGAGAVVAIVALAVYTGSFAIGLGPVFWLLISELYPQQLRGTAMSLATVANWAANFVVTISFLTLLNAITNAGTFLLFAAITLVALAYFALKVPETKGRTLQDIERDLT